MPRLLLALGLLPALAAPALAETLVGTCVSAHDGDTLTVQIRGQQEKVRLLGIDTPELAQAPWGPRAAAFTRRLAVGHEVRLETDVQPRDRYGRILAYVHVGRTFLNLELARQGYAMLLTYPPNVAHTADFVAATREARTRGLNIWGTDGLRQTPYEFRHPGRRSPSQELAPTGHPYDHGRGRPDVASDLVAFNPRSHKFHDPGCTYAHDLKLVPRVEALATGGVPCKRCGGGVR